MAILLWIVLPYSAFACFALGWAWRHRQARVRSPAILEDRRAHRWEAVVFRIGIGLVIIVRIADFLASGPHTHPHGAIYLAITTLELVAVPTTVISAVLLTIPELISARSEPDVSPLDRLTLPVLVATLLSGVTIEFDPNSTAGQYRTAETLFTWFRGLLTLHPPVAVMQRAPLVYQVRGLLLMVLLAIWPYTRLAAVFAVPGRRLRAVEPASPDEMPSQRANEEADKAGPIVSAEMWHGGHNERSGPEAAA
jgi:nitrate reductase gamma subunit